MLSLGVELFADFFLVQLVFADVGVHLRCENRGRNMAHRLDTGKNFRFA